ncbi:MAG: DegT/DnrJ/EryC1/StrS family aminotransferase [Planctomycetota bacterium]
MSLLTSPPISHHSQGEQIPLVDLKAQVRSLDGELKAALQGVQERCDFILGGAVSEFESAFAHWLNAKHAVGVASGLDALMLALMALDIGPGDEVLVPANTFIATALAASRAGARPVLVDCDPGTYNIDVERLESAITPRTRAILPVHLTGQPADMAPLLDIAARSGLEVVEDAAQAHGARYRGQRCGTMGRAGCFSFYPGKNLGGFGDGGLVATNDADLAKRLRCLRNYGQQEKYHHLVTGTNSRLDTIQAAVLNVKLPHLDGWNEARARHAERYREQLAGVGDLVFPITLPDVTHVHHLFMIETVDRDGLLHHLKARGIQAGIHYPVPVHLQPAYANLGYRAGDFPVAERLAARILSLPMYPELRGEQIDRVVAGVSSWFS